jgi:hypothetical protein
VTETTTGRVTGPELGRTTGFERVWATEGGAAAMGNATHHAARKPAKTGTLRIGRLRWDGMNSEANVDRLSPVGGRLRAAWWPSVRFAPEEQTGHGEMDGGEWTTSICQRRNPLGTTPQTLYPCRRYLGQTKEGPYRGRSHPLGCPVQVSVIRGRFVLLPASGDGAIISGSVG